MEAPRGGPLYKILSRAAWAAAGDVLPWADIDRQDGFVHLSAVHQVRETAARHFANRDDLVLVEVDPGRVPPDALTWEVSRGGDRFPHVYGDVPRAALGAAVPLSTRDGVRFPPHVASPVASPLPEPLALRLEIAEAATVAGLAEATPGQARGVRRGLAVATWFGPGSPVNAVKGWGLDPVTPEDLAAFEAWFGPMRFAVEVSTYAPSEALSPLATAGYRAVAMEHVLVRALDGGGGPADVHLEPTDQASEWAAVVARGFGLDAPSPEMIATVHAAQHRAFFIVMDGVRVGACAMRIDHELVQLMATSVLPEHRGRGAHTGSLAHRLAHAAALGCRFAKIDVEPGSVAHHNAARAGFVTSHARVAFTKRS